MTPDALHDLGGDERGVSEILGYALIFAAVMSTIVLVSVSMTPVLKQTESQHAALAMEYQFEHINHEIRKVEFGQQSMLYRTELPAGELRQTQETQINITSSSGRSINITTYPLEYRTDQGQVVVYDAGVIAKTPGDGGLENGQDLQVVRVPPETNMQDNFMFRAAALSHPTGRLAYSRSNAPSVVFYINQTNHENNAYTQTFNSNETVQMTVTTNYPQMWEKYLTAHKAFTVTSTSPANYSTGERTTITAEFSPAAPAVDNGESLTVISSGIEISLANK